MLALALFIGLCLAALALVERWSDVEIRAYLDPLRLAIAAVFQLAATFITVRSWRSVVSRYLSTQISLAESAAHIGLVLIGKYFPGKIWGGVARGLLVHQRGPGVNEIIHATVVEQLMYLHAGAAVAGSAVAFIWSPIAGAGAVVLSVASVCLGADVLHRIIGFALRVANKLRGETSPLPRERLVVHPAHYRVITLWFAAQWLLLGLVLIAVFAPMSELGEPRLVLSYLAALPVAVVCGFVALWAPGGIGVREAMLVAMLAPVTSIELAAVVALFYRLWCVLLDLLTGGFALIYLRVATRAPSAS